MDGWQGGASAGTRGSYDEAVPWATAEGTAPHTAASEGYETLVATDEGTPQHGQSAARYDGREGASTCMCGVGRAQGSQSLIRHGGCLLVQPSATTTPPPPKQDLLVLALPSRHDHCMCVCIFVAYQQG